MNEICKQIEEQIKAVEEQKVQTGNIEYLYKLVDIHKDLKNEEYWKEKLNMMRERNYGGYDDYNGYDNYRNSYGNSYGNNYGARGYDTKYRGNDMLYGAQNEYNRYMENRNRYGNDEEKSKSFNYMLKSLEDFAHVIFEEAESQEQRQMIKNTARRIADM